MVRIFLRYFSCLVTYLSLVCVILSFCDPQKVSLACYPVRLLYSDMPRHTVGMGKTIMISSLLHTSRDPEPSEPPGVTPEVEEVSAPTKPRQLKLDGTFRPVTESNPRNAVQAAPSATLIVAPTSLMSQWSKELERSSKKGSLKVLVWHGNNRDDLDDILDGKGKTDVVITSYGVVGSEWTKHENSSRHGSPLFQGMSTLTIPIAQPDVSSFSGMAASGSGRSA
jgi:SNF2 family DNA or RNA helicase